jgi:REP element-mobilizing transposase RayT
VIIAHHLIWTAYGWWLGNDPRGSMSEWIRSDLISELGELHYGRKRVQPRSIVIREFYERAEDRLKYPLLTFNSDEQAVLGRAIEHTIGSIGYTCYACAIMPDHIHILIRKHKHLAEDMIRNLQRETHLALRSSGLRDQRHPIWGGHGWKVFLDHPNDVWRTIRYVEMNPVKLGLPEQMHPFVIPYDNWPHHRMS